MRANISNQCYCWISRSAFWQSAQYVYSCYWGEYRNLYFSLADYFAILLFGKQFLGGVALAFVYGYFGTFEGTLLNYYPIKASMILVDPTCGAEYGYTYHIFPAFIIMVLTFLISVIILANKKKDARILTVAKKKKIVRKKGW